MGSYAIAQPPMHERYPDTLFKAPLDKPLTLSGSFGELRGGHFHSGVDFTTGERPGKPVKAIADGYVARIKVSASGFGKALYIRHGNGYTSVYAHLSEFQEPIAKYVKKAQYQQESYELNLYPGEGRFNVKQAEVIGQSGNSGSSTGPHLHFEIRETRTEKPLNPLFFGFSIKDSRSPVIRGIRLYPEGPKSQVKVVFDNGRQPVKSSAEPINLKVRKASDQYRLANVNSLCGRGKIGVGVAVTDYHDRSSHALGVSRLNLQKDGENVFKSTIDKFRFAQTRYVNAHLDYAAQRATNQEYQRCFVLPGNQLPFYETKAQGLIQMMPDEEAPVTLTTADTYGNKARISWNLKYCQQKIEPLQIKSNNPVIKSLPHDAASTVKTSGLKLEFPAGAFYDTINFTMNKENEPNHTYGPVYQVHNHLTPVHKYYRMAMDATSVPAPLRDDALIVYLESGSEMEAVGGHYNDGFVKARARKFGKFTIAVDTVAPYITLVNVPKGRSYATDRPLRVRITDDLAGITSYKPKIDGDWVRMAYDQKTDLLTFRDFERLESGKHKFQLVAWDQQGNKRTFEKTFKTP